MELMLLRVFQRQVLLQCQFLLRAAQTVNAALNENPPDSEGVFCGLENMLNAGANISKALWGQGGKLATERQALRDSIGIRDGSPLSPTIMRNHFEHFDERLDKWWAESANHNFADMNIGPASMISGLPDTEKFRSFDPQTTDVVFWGQSFNLQELVDEVTRILPTLLAEAAKPHWEPKQPNHQEASV